MLSAQLAHALASSFQQILFLLNSRNGRLLISINDSPGSFCTLRHKAPAAPVTNQWTGVLRPIDFIGNVPNPGLAAIVSQEKPARSEISVPGQFSSRGCLRSFLLLIVPFYEIIECHEKLAEDIFLGGDGSLWKRTV
ncbi:MAG: hypothetical protein ABS69_05890 [Nitrosomonadales bacterium SCN 54-20]|nr:MAG: hypothetical protein ABS69_05890 [Nitrosomonadales bacterium SCN 54-20]